MTTPATQSPASVTVIPWASLAVGDTITLQRVSSGRGEVNPPLVGTLAEISRSSLRESVLRSEGGGAAPDAFRLAGEPIRTFTNWVCIGQERA